MPTITSLRLKKCPRTQWYIEHLIIYMLARTLIQKNS